MNVVRACALRTLRRLVLPSVFAIGFAWLATRADAVRTTTGDADFAALVWLHVPALWLTGAALLIAIDEWPLFHRGREDAAWIARIAPGPWHGCAAAMAGALLGLATGLGIVAAVFAALLTASEGAHVRARVPLPAIGEPTLVPNAGTIRFDARDAGSIAQLDVRATPIRRVGDPILPVGLEVFADGARLHDAPFEVAASSHRVRLRFEARDVEQIEVRRSPGYAPVLLSFPPNAIEAGSATERSAIGNAILAALSYLLPATLALATLCVLRRVVRGPVAVVLLLGVPIIATVLELTPNGAAIDACARGRWLPSEPLLTSSLVFAIWFTLAMVASAFVGRRR